MHLISKSHLVHKCSFGRKRTPLTIGKLGNAARSPSSHLGDMSHHCGEFCF